MLKKVLCISAALALAVSLTACSTYLEKSGTYDVETGDRVKIIAKVQQCRQTDAGSNPAGDLRVPSF